MHNKFISKIQESIKVLSILARFFALLYWNKSSKTFWSQVHWVAQRNQGNSYDKYLAVMETGWKEIANASLNKPIWHTILN